MANLKRNNSLEYLNLAFELAKINLGSTKENPSVGCVVEKNGSIISSGFTSINGRPHAESNALKKNINFKNANIYITLEPCSHYGKTPPCTNIIKKKGIKKVFYSINDFDKRSKNKSQKVLLRKKISISKFNLKNKGLKFYESYYRFKANKPPIVDAKIAVSNDYFTKNIKNKWITNESSRRLTHLLRSKYNVIISTSKTINEDNSILDCRINGLTDKSPDLIIFDRNLRIKKNLSMFKTKVKRKIFIFTTKKNMKKIRWLKKNNIKVFLKKNMNTFSDYKILFKSFTNLGYSRVLVESGLTFMNFLINNKLINEIYIFKTKFDLNKYGLNSSSNKLIKKIKLKNKLKVNLGDDVVYKEKISNV